MDLDLQLLLGIPRESPLTRCVSQLELGGEGFDMAYDEGGYGYSCFAEYQHYQMFGHPGEYFDCLRCSGTEEERERSGRRVLEKSLRADGSTTVAGKNGDLPPKLQLVVGSRRMRSRDHRA